MHAPAQILKYCSGRNGRGEFASHTGTAGGRKMASRNSQEFRLYCDGADKMQAEKAPCKGARSFILPGKARVKQEKL